MPPPLPGMGGPRPPPPMGLAMPRGLAPPPKLPVKPKGPKRRPVHWDKIAPANLEQTVFSEIDPSSVVSSALAYLCAPPDTRRSTVWNVCFYLSNNGRSRGRFVFFFCSC